MPNHLEHENSPYLLQHADNPVDWYPWDEEALEKSRREDKPIFLSIGYAACHWCHVMAHESFEEPQTAAIMNQYFVNIKVDREERPDLDSIYMNAVVAMTGQGGWPMSIFLTPDGVPFFGGTYFPPIRHNNMPSFYEVLLSIADAWRKDRKQLIETGNTIIQHIRSNHKEAGEPLNKDLINQAVFNLAQTYDWKQGGWGKAPKFPQPMAIEFLLRRASRGDKLARDISVHVLHAMARGGMYDVVGGGFARYSTDNQWLIPHFEKMLYDNALLSQVYLHGYLLTGDIDFKRICEDTLAFVTRELTHPEGGFYSSLDADSEGQEGKYYTWSLDEIKHVLDNYEDLDFFLTAYNVSDAGNFEGRNVLQRSLDNTQLADKFNIPIDQVALHLADLHSRLLQVRSKRVRPMTDDKVLTAWNALMLLSFAEAARYLRRSDYLDIAIHNAQFIGKNLLPGDRLLRSWRAGMARHNAYLEDHAALIMALLSLYQSDPNPIWFSTALNLNYQMEAHFTDNQGGFFDTRDDHEPLLSRPKVIQDNATPSGNALAALAMLELVAYTNRRDLYDQACAMLETQQQTAVRYPTAFAYWLSAMDFAIGPLFEVAVLGDTGDPHTQALIETLWSTYRPRAVTAISSYPPPPESPPLLIDKPLLNGQPTAYICQNFTCRQPVNDQENLRSQLLDNL